MQRRTQVLGIGIAAVLAAAAAGIGSAGAVPGGEIVAKGRLSFEPNRFVRSDQRFSPDIKYATSGGTITLRNQDGAGEPHTFTFMPLGDRPRTAEDVFNCTVCEPVLGQHFPNGDNGAPVPILNAGQPGLDQAGDSYLVFPGQSVQVKVSAPPGTNLYYLCVFHPWMQARVNVR